MHIYTVSEITAYIKSIFDNDRNLTYLYIKGEISNYKQHFSGHCYFTIKDDTALIKVVMFKSKAQYINFQPVNGMKVIVGGRISVFERDGLYQVYAEQLIPDGIGELSLAYNQLKDKLSAEGLFDQKFKRPLPLFPASVGVVTSLTGAALRDIITVAKRRCPMAKILLCPVQVQGLEAPGQIIKALDFLNRLKQVDVIIVGRGGGSLEELWAFNNEMVVRAIRSSVIPVVSAVGHQTDFTLADFAADVRAATPSHAAEIALPDTAELFRYINAMTSIMRHSINGIMKKLYLRLNRCLESRTFAKPNSLLADRQQQLDNNIQRLEQAYKIIVLGKRHEFVLAAEKIAILNPLSVLARGYSIIRDSKGSIVSDANNVSIGQQLKVSLKRGQLTVRVLDTKGDK